MAKQVRVSDQVSGLVDELEITLKASDPLINSRQSVVSKAIIELHRKVLKNRKERV